MERSAGWTASAWLFAALALAVTGARILALAASPIDLHGDEAQYWLWSRTLDWGYFSKPPLIAWTIAGTTALFGDAEWAVRLAAPIAHALGAGALFALGAAMFSREVGFWAGLGWLIMPGVWLSATLISTDALLLPLWSLALLASWKLMETRSWAWALVLGAALGLGMLAKYAMLYFLAGAGLAALWIPAMRTALIAPQGAFAAAVAAGVVAPNIAWNAANSFATVSHTVANAHLEGPLFNLDELGEFLLSQFGVMGPIAFALLAVFTLAAAGRFRRLSEEDRFLLAFLAPPLIVIMIQAFASRAHGNWAAAAYPAAIVFVAARLVAMRARWLLWTNAAAHAAIGAAFIAALVLPAFADRIGLANGLKRARAWEETAAAVRERLDAGGPYDAILVDNRLAFNDLAYYWRDDAPGARLVMWRLYAEPHNHAEAVAALAPDPQARVLIVGLEPSYVTLIAGDFRSAGPLEEAAIPLGGGITRRLLIREAEGFDPAPRDTAFLERVRTRPDPDPS
jgi:4-amino-4-deoxy-L-arabinose transferase-like glycosyltransferase